MTPENKTVEIVVDNPRGGKTVVMVEGRSDAHLVEQLRAQGFDARLTSPEIRSIDPEAADLLQAQADKKAGKETYLDIPESELPVPEFLPFEVANRTRAEKVVKLLYGPKARVRTFPNQDVAKTQVVLQEGNRAIVLREAATLAGLLSEPLESYVKGGRDLQDTERRISEVVRFAELGAMAYRALMQFPEYVDKRRRQLFKQREAQAKLRIPFKDLVIEAKAVLKQIGPSGTGDYRTKQLDQTQGAKGVHKQRFTRTGSHSSR